MLSYRSFGLRLLGIFIVYTAFRWLFLGFNLSLFPDLTTTELMRIAWGGMRFDLTTICYTNSVFILIYILPFNGVKYPVVRGIAKWSFVVFNGMAIAIHCADLVFYPFNGKRMDMEVLALLQTLPTLIVQFFKDYWYVFVLYGVLMFGLVKLYEWPRESTTTIAWWKRLLFFCCTGAIAVIVLRGGITNKRPISPASAAFHAQTNNLPLVTNSVYTFLYSVLNNQLKGQEYYTNQELKINYPVGRTFNDSMETPRKPNIVLIIMESFSKAYVGTLTGGPYSHTPYFDTLLTKGSYCKNAFANGRRSSQGLVALTSGIPALMTEPFMYSCFSGNRIDGVPKLVSNEGYRTAFFNGSPKDLLGWDEYINQTGFQRYYSMEDYTDQSHFDGNWGIYDHHMFDFFESVIDTTSTPFFYTFFSISAHHPYKIPKEFEAQFDTPQGSYLNALQYSDWSLARFFERIKDKPWFKHTLFVVTADHTLNGESFTESRNQIAENWYQNRVGLYAVPVFYLHPYDSVKRRIEVPVSHVDVSASILKWSGYKGSAVSWGTPIDELHEDNTAIQFVNGIYQIENNEFVLLFADGESMGLYRYKEDARLEHNLLGQKEYAAIEDQLSRRLKAGLQQHHTRMINGQLFYKPS